MLAAAPFPDAPPEVEEARPSLILKPPATQVAAARPGPLRSSLTADMQRNKHWRRTLDDLYDDACCATPFRDREPGPDIRNNRASDGAARVINAGGSFSLAILS